MSRTLPPLDLHAHVDANITPRALEGLGAVVFAVTRSLDEYEEVARRSDTVTVWGIGCHPGLATAQESFDSDRFSALLKHAAFVGEVGLDASSKVSLDRQTEVLTAILMAVVETPRLTSIHSYRATREVLDLVEQVGIRGVILHWWLGSASQTKRALSLGCLFSVNESMSCQKLIDAGVPISSILPETDHPDGNRRGVSPRQPGQTMEVERTLARAYGMTIADVREQFWSTLAGQLGTTEPLLPSVVRSMLSHVR